MKSPISAVTDVMTEKETRNFKKPVDKTQKLYYNIKVACVVVGVAQLVEHWTFNPGVPGSSPG